MKALSLIQPWASAMRIRGEKRIETRSWSTKYRGPLAIHASKKLDTPALVRLRDAGHDFGDAAVWWDLLPTGAVLGVVMLHTVAVMTDATIDATSDRERAWGDHRAGRFAWVTTPLVWFREPIPWGGALGLWEWPAPDAVTIAVNVARGTGTPHEIFGSMR